MTLLSCPFCSSVPTFSDVEEKDDRRYVEMRLECCITMQAGIGWRSYRDMSHPDRKEHLQKELTASWNKRAYPLSVTDMDEDIRERVQEAVAESMTGIYYCGRVWSAWGYGTMSRDDFSPAGEDDDIVANIVDAAVAAIFSAE